MTTISPQSPVSQRQPRIRDQAYRRSFKGQICIACDGQDGTVVGAHIRAGNEGGTALKPSDNLILPLCFWCHGAETVQGQAWWEQALNMTIDEVKALARQRYADWKNPSVDGK